jgi:hypothetical protein
MNLTNDYYLLEVKFVEKRIGATTDKFTIEEIKNKLGLAYERLNGHSRKPVN